MCVCFFFGSFVFKKNATSFFFASREHLHMHLFHLNWFFFTSFCTNRKKNCTNVKCAVKKNESERVKMRCNVWILEKCQWFLPIFQSFWPLGWVFNFFCISPSSDFRRSVALLKYRFGAFSVMIIHQQNTVAESC